MEPLSQDVLALAARAHRVTVLTGAGMSAESGIETFRDAQTGLWQRFDPVTLATPQAFADDPDLVWGWYRWRSSWVRDCRPNAGHRALAEWAERPGVDLRIATQNVDDLHERAGSRGVAHLHGSLFALRCSRCGADASDEQPLPTTEVERLPPPRCERCGGNVRPGVVWFGEELPREAWESAETAVENAELVLVVGSSGAVRPAADLPYLALERGTPVVEIGPEPTEFTSDATHAWRSTAATALPDLVAALI